MTDQNHVACVSAVRYWNGQSVPLLPPASDEEIELTFSKFGLPVSNDVRSLFRMTAGFREYESVHLWSLWSLDRIALENQRRDPEIVWFADWLICSHMYGIKYTDSNSSEIYIDHDRPQQRPQKIACSMFEFLAKYVENPNDIEAWKLI